MSKLHELLAVKPTKEGEVEGRRLVLAADGALTIKIDAYLRAQEFWANAFGNYHGNIVPGVIVGSGTGTGANATSGLDFIQLMGIKAAKDLALDLNIPSTR